MRLHEPKEPNLVTRQQRRADARRAKKRAMKLAAGTAAALGASMLAGEANAATIVVNTLADNLIAGDGQCTLREAIVNANDNAATSPDCAAGEGVPVVDVIQFQAGLSGTIALDPNVDGPYSGQLEIRESVTINGPGRDVLTISGASSSRVFYIYTAGATGDVTLTGMEIADGIPLCGEGCSSFGAGVLAINSDLTLTDVRVRNNSAFNPVSPALIPGPSGGPPFGGGIAKLGSGTLAITNSEVRENLAIGGGGIFIDDSNGGAHTLNDVSIADNAGLLVGGGVFAGLNNGSTLTVQNSVVTGNGAGFVSGPYSPGVAEPPPGYFYGTGGGIFASAYTFYGSPSVEASSKRAKAKTSGLPAPSGVLIEDTTISGNSSGYGGGLTAADIELVTIRRTTISGNSAVVSGAGAFIGYAGNFISENSTFAENTSDGSGGGLAIEDTPFTIEETTISGNTAQPAGGAGVFVNNDSYSPGLIENSIVANGQAPDLAISAATDADIVVASGTVTVNYTLVETPGAAPGWIDAGTNIVGQDPELGPLQDNGGPTFTMLPAPTSPVIDAGDPAFVPPPSTDQRGFPRVSGSAIDMGSVELNGGVVQLSATAVSVAEGAGFVTITATRTGGSEGPISVPFTTSPISATPTADYDPTGGTFVWADGDTAPKSVNIAIVNDALTEANETFTVTLGTPTGPATLGTPATETVTILDDEFGTVAFESATYTTGEGTTSVITVVRTGGSTGPVTVQVVVTGGTATSGADYTFAGTTLTWAAGEAGPKTFTIPTIGDAVVDPNETVSLALQTPTGGVVIGAQNTSVLTITEAAQVPTLGFLMKLLLILGVSGTGIVVLGRGRLLVYLLALCLAMAAAPPMSAEQLAKKPRQVRKRANVDTAAATIQEVTRTGDRLKMRIAGETFDLPRRNVTVRDMRGGLVYKRPGDLRAGNTVVFKVRRDRDGSVRRVRVLIFESLEKAKAAAEKQRAIR